MIKMAKKSNTRNKGIISKYLFWIIVLVVITLIGNWFLFYYFTHIPIPKVPNPVKLKCSTACIKYTEYLDYRVEIGSLTYNCFCTLRTGEKIETAHFPINYNYNKPIFIFKIGFENGNIINSTMAGKPYYIKFVETNKYPATLLAMVNGELTNKIAEGNTYTLKDGSKLGFIRYTTESNIFEGYIIQK